MGCSMREVSKSYMLHLLEEALEDYLVISIKADVIHVKGNGWMFNIWRFGTIEAANNPKDAYDYLKCYSPAFSQVFRNIMAKKYTFEEVR